jgi:hypothetical protein
LLNDLRVLIRPNPWIHKIEHNGTISIKNFVFSFLFLFSFIESTEHYLQRIHKESDSFLKLVFVLKLSKNYEFFFFLEKPEPSKLPLYFRDEILGNEIPILASKLSSKSTNILSNSIFKIPMSLTCPTTIVFGQIQEHSNLKQIKTTPCPVTEHFEVTIANVELKYHLSSQNEQPYICSFSAYIITKQQQYQIVELQYIFSLVMFFLLVWQQPSHQRHIIHTVFNIIAINDSVSVHTIYIQFCISFTFVAVIDRQMRWLQTADLMIAM